MSHVSLFLALALTLSTCGGTQAIDACRREPLGSTNAFFAGGSPQAELTATVAAITPLPDLGGYRYDLQELSGTVRKLTWIAPTAMEGIEAGRRYRFVVDYAGGFPDSSGILVYDGETLYFAALTDQTLFAHVLKSGVPGFSMKLGEPSCGSRGSTKCHPTMVNLPLIVASGGTEKTLHHGETAVLGDYVVQPLTAQRVTYSPRCADAGVPGVSLIITRRK